MTKLYSINELINENIRLKKQLSRLELKHMKDILGIWDFLHGKVDNPEDFRGLSIPKVINGLKQSIEELE